ncbi:MAG: hypothetical protein Kow00121_04030 [Elainellaceae cyanobacterium]
MTPIDIEVILQEVFDACEAGGYPLSAFQREILFRVLIDRMAQVQQNSMLSEPEPEERSAEPVFNPLSELTQEERQVILQFIREQARHNRSWKAQLLNDWLHDRDSGAIQFVRERYGLQWLEQIQPEHIAQYRDEILGVLKAGDRIEVSNGLWEWVQDDGPCPREWFPCTVVSIREVSIPPNTPAEYSHQTNCTIRFDNGMEYEIQGIYEWNRYNWRWSTEP